MLTIGVRVALTAAGGRHEPLALQIHRICSSFPPPRFTIVNP